MPITFKKKTKDSAVAGIASFLTIFILAWLTDNTGFNFLMAPFGATTALVYTLPKAQISQAKNILFGYTSASAVSFLLFHFLGYEESVMALGVGIAVFLMMFERIVHPPAVSIPVFFYYVKPEPEFLLFPILSGCVVIIILRKTFKIYKAKTNGRT